MDLLSMTQPLRNDHPFVKLALQGFQGSGKTFTMGLIAAGLYDMLKAKDGQEPELIIYDTEIASHYLLPQFQKRGIKNARNLKSRSLENLTRLIDQAEKHDKTVILLIDSITHVWKNVVNEWKTQKRKSYLTMHDWGILIPKWENEFSQRFLESKVHIMFTGRAGYSYEDIEDEDTGKKKLTKTGTRMKVQGETSFEPSILIEMEQHQEIKPTGKKVWVTATIAKDRYAMIHGQVFKNPTFAKFKPVIKQILSGTAADGEIFQDSREQFNIEDAGTQWKQQKDEALEEIQNIFTILGFGNSAAHKQLKFKILEEIFQQLSWKAIEGMRLKPLTEGLEKLRNFRQGWEQYVNDQNSLSQALDVDEAYNILERVTTPADEQPEPQPANY